jgi:hypothetical protein
VTRAVHYATDRTIVVLTRVSEELLHATYCNALDERQPYLVTSVLHGPPFAPIGVSTDKVPEVGHTIAVVLG